MRKIGIVGSGVLVSYICNSLPSNIRIDVFEIQEMVTLPRDNISKFPVFGNVTYRGHHLGRRIGKGGTSNVWGGQEFSFSQIDEAFISSANSFQRGLISESSFDKDLGSFSVKQGRWIWPWFKKARIVKRRNVKVIFESVLSVDFGVNGSKTIKTTTRDHRDYDIVFLAAGVFGNMTLTGIESCIYKDHLSVHLGKLESENFPSNLVWEIGWKGLVTKRLVFKNIEMPHYVHFVFNKETVLIENFRKYIKGQISLLALFPRIIIELPTWLGMFFQGKFSPIKGSEIDVILDIEALKVNCNVPMKRFDVSVEENELRYIHRAVKDELVKMGLKINFSDFNMTNYEDIYHPVSINPPKSKLEYFERSKGIYRIDTGLLETCASTNPTATLYGLIDNILEHERN